MSVKVILVLSAQALLVQSVLSFCTSRAAIESSGIGPYGLAAPSFGLRNVLANNGLIAPGLAYNGLANRGLPCDGLLAPAMEFTATSGGGLAVTSSSAIAPTGITVVSENVFEGPLSVAGELPFVGTTDMDGAMPSAGSGAIDHGCGDGVTAMVSEANIVPGVGIAPAVTTVPGAGFGPISGLGLGFGSAAGLSRFGPTNRLGLGGCGSRVLY